MSPEECELFLSINEQEHCRKRILFEYWNPNRNGRHNPLCENYVIPEEMEPCDFNNKTLKFLNEHMATKGVELRTQQSNERE